MPPLYTPTEFNQNEFETFPTFMFTVRPNYTFPHNEQFLVCEHEQVDTGNKKV